MRYPRVIDGGAATRDGGQIVDGLYAARVTWPADLPSLVPTDEYTEEWDGGTIRSDMDVGSAKVRRRFFRTRRTFARMIYLTAAQYASLLLWYDTVLGGGAVPFQVQHPISGELLLLRFAGNIKVTTIGPLYYAAHVTVEEI